MVSPYPVRVTIPPENSSVPDGGCIKHVEFKGKDVKDYCFSYKKLEKNLFFQYLIRKKIWHQDRLMTVTFKAPTTHFCTEVLRRGIFCNEKCYRFLGFSECQMRERTCYMIHNSESGIENLLSEFGDFSEIEDPRRRARILGLLFAKFDILLELSDADDIEVKSNVNSHCGRHPFSFGCGFMYPRFHSNLRSQLASDCQYLGPSAVLVRYQGYEGMLVLKEEPQKNARHQVQFHEPLQNLPFREAIRDAFPFICVVDYSKPNENGYLDNLLIMMLIDRGVSVQYIKKLQTEYFELLKNICKDKTDASYFLRLTGRTRINTSAKELAVLRKREIDNMIDYVGDPERTRRGVSRTHILVPEARLVFGVCDPYENLENDECYFKPTLPDDESKEFATKKKVIVACLPCYHPGEIRVLKLAHQKKGYENLVDCLVLPVKGLHPDAFKCGSKLFVSWDVKLIPQENVCVDLCSYQPTLKERVQETLATCRGPPKRETKEIRNEMIDFFARPMDNLPNKIDKIYTTYVKALGPSSKECKQLHKMFYQATHLTVDADVLQKKLLEEFEQKDPGRQRNSSADQPPSESCGLLEDEEDDEKLETPFKRRSCEGLLNELLNWLPCHRRPSVVHDYEAEWNAFDEQTANFVQEMQQEQA